MLFISLLLFLLPVILTILITAFLYKELYCPLWLTDSILFICFSCVLYLLIIVDDKLSMFFLKIRNNLVITLLPSPDTFAHDLYN